MIKSFLRMVIIIVLLSIVQGLKAQPLPPDGGHGQTGDQVPGGGAPLDTASGLLIILSFSYAMKKYRQNKKGI